MSKLNLISGATGQDAYFLTKYLLQKGERVIGLKRRTATDTTENIREFLGHPGFELVEADITDYTSIFSLLNVQRPDKVFQLAAQSHVGTSFKQPFYTTQVNYNGQLNFLESLRVLKDEYAPKLYFACHDKETKILTPNGIKSYDEVSVGDLVYSINENTREIEIKPIINKINYHYKGDMVGIKSRRINQLVTPNHKVLFCDDTDLIKDDASNLTNYIKHSSVSKYSMPVGKHYGKKNDDIILETSKENHSKNIIDKIDCYSYALIMGLYLGDGYIKSKKYKTRNISRSEFRNNRDDSGKFKTINNDNYTKEKRLTSRIEFAIPENDKARNLICSLFDSLGFEYGKNDTIVWLSCYGLSKKLLEDCGIKFDGKFIPEWVYDYDIKFLQNLLKGLLYSDGDADRQYFTSNEKLMTDVVRLIFSLGYYPSVNKKDETVSWYAKENRYIRSTTPRYDISIGFTGKNKIYSNHIQKKYYNDLVWCLEIEDNHNFLIIRDGKIAFSGNCTSETFGKNYDLVDNKKKQGINTEFEPQSPYGVAKLAAFHLTRIYREAYGIYACSGILHNHETITSDMPLIYKEGNSKEIHIAPIADIVKKYSDFNKDSEKYQEGYLNTDIYVWDNNDWTKVKYFSGYKHKGDKNPRIINARNGSYFATGSHVCIMENDEEKKTVDLKIGDKIKNINYPSNVISSDICLEYAEFLGMIVGDGHIDDRNRVRFINSSNKFIFRVLDLFNVFCPNGSYRISDVKSGFKNSKKNIKQIDFNGFTLDKNSIYSLEKNVFGHRLKIIPKCILNGNLEIMEAFLVGYNNADGLKSGGGKYRFKNFKTNSAALASGLLFLINKVTGQDFNITVDNVIKNDVQQFYYSLNILTDKKDSIEKYNIIHEYLDKDLSQREISRKTGISRSFIRKVVNGYIPSEHNWKRSRNEIKKIIDVPNYNGWFFDLTTESGTFHCGVGNAIVHNSPLRGEHFLTRKVTKYVAELYHANQKGFLIPKLQLGNLDAYRDWSYAGDMVRAMDLILSQPKPADYVVSSDECHSVREFVDLAFRCIGENYEHHIEINPEFYRPAEVDYLCGDSTPIRSLGWQPTVNFNMLVKLMVEADIARQS